MYRSEVNHRLQMEMVWIDELVPADHPLRLVDAVLDLSWVDGRVAHLYSRELGAPNIPPQTVVRLLLAGWLLGTPGLRPLLRRAETDVAVRWFCGYGLTDRLPDHSSLSKILKRWGPELFEELFERSVGQCREGGLVGGETTHFDGTLIRADVSWKSLTRRYVETVVAEAEAEEGEEAGRRPPPVRFAGKGEKMVRAGKKRSRTDPDATLATSRKDHPLQPSYKAHVAVDDRAQVVVAVVTTTGERSESEELVGVLEEAEERSGQRAGVVTADAGCASGGNYAALEERGQTAVIPPQPEGRGQKRKDGTVSQVPLRRMKYDPVGDRVVCPRKVVLRRTRTEGEGVWYEAPAEQCRGCPLFRVCVPPTGRSRRVRIGFGYEALLRARRAKERGWPAEWEAERGAHRGKMEGWHGEAKEQHGLRRAVFRGLPKVRMQVWLTAAAMNLKRLAKAVAGGKEGLAAAGGLGARCRRAKEVVERWFGALLTVVGRSPGGWAAAARG